MKSVKRNLHYAFGDHRLGTKPSISQAFTNNLNYLYSAFPKGPQICSLQQAPFLFWKVFLLSFLLSCCTSRERLQEVPKSNMVKIGSSSSLNLKFGEGVQCLKVQHKYFIPLHLNLELAKEAGSLFPLRYPHFLCWSYLQTLTLLKAFWVSLKHSTKSELKHCPFPPSSVYISGCRAEEKKQKACLKATNNGQLPRPIKIGEPMVLLHKSQTSPEEHCNFNSRL